MKKSMAYLPVLIGIALYTSPAPCTAKDAPDKISGKLSQSSVDLSTKESRAKWLNDWLASVSTLLDRLSPEEAAEYAIGMTKAGIRGANGAYARMPQSQRMQADDELFDSTVGSMLQNGDYLAVPHDGSPPFAWRMATTREGRNSIDIAPEHLISRLVGQPIQQVNQSIPQTEQPQQAQQLSPEQQANYDKYKKWRKSFIGRLYAVQMGNSGFVQMIDPMTGIERWVPKNSVGVTRF